MCERSYLCVNADHHDPGCDKVAEAGVVEVQQAEEVHAGGQAGHVPGQQDLHSEGGGMQARGVRLRPV